MKKLIIVVVFGAVMLTNFSCYKSRLTPAPADNNLDASVGFDNRQRIESQVRGIYGNAKNAGLFGGRYQIFNDIRGADFKNDRTNVVTGFDIWNYTPSNSSANSILAVWTRMYLVINQVNVFLEGMEAGGTAVVGETLSRNFQGEARLMRALCYYGMLQFYARPHWDGNGSKPGLPLRLTANKSAQDYSLERSTVAQIYAQIITDLNFAEQSLPLTQGSDLNNTIRAHRNTAIALKTRVYLSMQRYGDVITEANKIVSAAAPFRASTGVAHALQADVSAVFRSPYTTTESIFSMPFTDNDAPGTQNQMGFYYLPAAVNGGNGEYSLAPTGIVANTGWKDADRRRTMVVTSGSNRYLSKYAGRAPFIDYAPVIRYAEVLLNLAEARVRSTNTVDAQAIALLNAVRGRSDASTVFLAGDFASSNALADALLIERRIELLGEGLAGADLTRLGLPLPAKGSVAAVPASAQQYIWPIPSTELLLNPKMTDN